MSLKAPVALTNGTCGNELVYNKGLGTWYTRKDWGVGTQKGPGTWYTRKDWGLGTIKDRGLGTQYRTGYTGVYMYVGTYMYMYR